MKVVNYLRAALVKAGFVGFRGLILHAPDWFMVRVFRVIRWLAYLVTGDKMVRRALTDVIAIFEGGPPFSMTLRKLVKGSEPELVANIVRCQRKATPYGL